MDLDQRMKCVYHFVLQQTH